MPRHAIDRTFTFSNVIAKSVPPPNVIRLIRIRNVLNMANVNDLIKLSMLDNWSTMTGQQSIYYIGTYIDVLMHVLVGIEIIAAIVY